MKDKKEQFLMVPYTILNNKELTDGDKMVLSLVYSYYNNNKKIFISNNALGKMFGISRTAASERVTKLERLGYVRCERKNERSRLIIPLRMESQPTIIVGKPNTLVGKPNIDSRQTDHQIVGKVGTIILPSLLDKELDNNTILVLDKVHPLIKPIVEKILEKKNAGIILNDEEQKLLLTL